MSAQKLQQSFHYENCFVENKKNCKVKMLHRNFGVIISSHKIVKKKNPSKSNTLNISLQLKKSSTNWATINQSSYMLKLKIAKGSLLFTELQVFKPQFIIYENRDWIQQQPPYTSHFIILEN
jgi:hypothetical protein